MKINILNWFYRTFLNPHGVDVQGYCPRQAWWVLDGKYYYFRARGSQWSLEISETDLGENIWSYCEKNYKEWPECGYLEEWECIKLVNKAMKVHSLNPDNQRLIVICKKEKK
jgi:hypothetical protein